MFDTKKTSEKLVSWLKEKVNSAGAKGGVFGLSGGIDSAVVAALCKKAFGENTMGIIMPCHSNKVDMDYANMVADKLDLKTEIVVLDEVFDTLIDKLGDDPFSKTMAVNNIKPRLRMTTLYYYAAKNNYLVVGTGNKSELTVGYFTKHGDSGVDLLPLGNLVKTQVRELAKYLEIPEEVIKRPPTAGLWEGQTDEKEMGITYEQLDKYILTGKAQPEIAEKIQQMERNSKHKRSTPPKPFE